MDIAEALQATIDLARQNLIDPLDNAEEHRRQRKAVDMVEDLAVNQYGDENGDNFEAEDTTLEKRRDHKIKGTLDLSGTTFKVGIYRHHEGDSLFIDTNEQAEPIYFSVVEADLLIAALNASKAELGED